MKHLKNQKSLQPTKAEKVYTKTSGTATAKINTIKNSLVSSLKAKNTDNNLVYLYW